MFPKLLIMLLFTTATSTQVQDEFTYNGFGSSNLSLSGLAAITNEGLLRLTNHTYQEKGYAFHSKPLLFNNHTSTTPDALALSFSTTFVFAILPHDAPKLGGHGLAFVISPSKDLSGALASQYLGLFNATNNSNALNPIVAVEFDTILSLDFGDINDNHVGINVNSLRSIASAPASYYSDEEDGKLTSLTLISGEPMQVWIDYNGPGGQLSVTLSPIDVPKPSRPLLSLAIDLSSIVKDEMYVGFSSSTGSLMSSHYILGWSLKMKGKAPALNLSSLPSLPKKRSNTKFILAILLPLITAGLVMSTIFGIVYVMRRVKFAEIIEDWELEYGPHTFSYKDLYMATKCFSDGDLLGSGGFGHVYRGVLPSSKIEVAVKKISHGSRQGMREFIAEIASIGRIRHRNLVRLLGYCRRKGELLLVYDFMPNGSLDKLLFDQTKANLSWAQRFLIVKGVASGLLYLHEEWVQLVLHRDIKASNVLLDHELNGALGDFGLARLYDHGSNPQTTNVVGTFGYIAPELARTGKATTGTDVFAFGVFLLEVACGKRPLWHLPLPETDYLILVDWVLDFWRRRRILDAVDPNLRNEYVVEEMELVLKLALLCAHPLAALRPSMRQVVEFLNGVVPLPSLSIDCFNATDDHIALQYDEGLDDSALTFHSSITESLCSDGR